MEIRIVNNAIIDYFLAKFRNKTTNTYECNICVDNISIFLAGEASNYLEIQDRVITTPLGEKICPIINEEVILIPILRAGVSMLGAFQRLLPMSKVGFVWAHRDENVLPIIDKAKFPKNSKGELEIAGKTIIILDTMLATAGTVNKTAEMIIEHNPRQIICVSVLSTPIGINNLSDNFSVLVTASVSDGLDNRAYIYPGVGDSGDRLYG